MKKVYNDINFALLNFIVILLISISAVAVFAEQKITEAKQESFSLKEKTLSINSTLINQTKELNNLREQCDSLEDSYIKKYFGD